MYIGTVAHTHTKKKKRTSEIFQALHTIEANFITNCNAANMATPKFGYIMNNIRNKIKQINDNTID